VTTRRLPHGPVTGQQCPHCTTLLQPLVPGNPYGQPCTLAGAVAAHVELLHPDRWLVWQKLKGRTP
jgi:hypothetical protein